MKTTDTPLTRAFRCHTSCLLASMMVMFASAAAVHAGTWSYTAWTGDSTTNISTANTIWAYHFASTTTATVNGVTVPGSAGGVSNSNVGMSGATSTYPTSTNNLTALGGSGSAVIAGSFVYNGVHTANTVTAKNLTVGRTYTMTFFGVGFDGAPTRRDVTFSAGSDSIVVNQNEFGLGNGIRVDYTFTATASTQACNLEELIPNSVYSWGLNAIALRTGPTVTTPTGSPATARAFHTTTLLPNGKTLVAGGEGGSRLASSELYDPASGTWATTGSLSTARGLHTATLLPNGKVLVAGGYGNSGGLASAELYDPASGTWSATGSLASPHYYHTATLLPNGKVLVAGGSDGGSPLASAELYDPANGTWTTTGSLTTGRMRHTATLLPDGKLLVAGGFNGISVLTSAELFDPANGTWTTTGSLNVARWTHSAVLLTSGKVLIGGGQSTGGSTSSSELYDPASGTWAVTGSLTTARDNFSATLLPNGKVLATGGFSLGNTLASTELYDPAAGTWLAVGYLAEASYGHTATLQPSGKVLIAGGLGLAGSPIARTELYDPANGSWSAGGSLATVHEAHTATPLLNGKVLVTGGLDLDVVRLSSTELYDPATNTWTAAGSLTTARNSHTASVLANGKVLVTGGYDAIGNLSSAELYDPATNTWTAAGSLTTTRSRYTASVLANGKVLVTGGDGNSGSLSSAELYDPATNTWTAGSSLTTARESHTASVLANGKVLVTGGSGNSGTLSSAELYDPATSTWTAAGSLTTTRSGYTASVLANGKVLVTGGQGNSGYLSSAELYDPATNTWTATSSLASPHAYHRAALLPNGKVLVAGGNTGTRSTSTSTELYDVGLGFSDAWRPVINTASINANDQLVLTGTGFNGISGGSSGTTQDSSTNYPVVQVRHLENEQTTFLRQASGTNTSNTSYTSIAMTGLPSGYYSVTVFTNGIPSVSSTVLFTNYPPTITNISPTSGSTLGGTSVIITGTDFTGATAVTFGGTPATSFTVDSATQITATPPAHAAGLASVEVTTLRGTNAPNSLYTFVAPFQNGSFEVNGGHNTSVAEAWTFGGSGSNVVRNDLGATQGAFGMVFNFGQSPSGGVISQTFITVPGQVYRLKFDFGAGVNSVATSISQLQVQVRNGPSAFAGAQTINAGSGTITSITGGSIVSNTNTPQVRDQSSFFPAVNSPAPNQEFSSTQFTFTAISAVSTVVFTDQSTGGSDNQDALLDNIVISPLPAPTIASLNPNGGTTAGGTSVVITGTDFTGATAVTFGGNPASPFTVDSDTQITATTPAHAAGPVSVVITTPSGLSTGGTGIFTYTAPEIAVEGNAIDITNGDTTPSITDGTQFPTTVVGVTSNRLFTIRNLGTGTLNLTGTPRVTVSGTNAAEFVVFAQPATTLAAGGSVNVQFNFTPAAIGLRTATVTIANDDSDENPFTFDIAGTGALLAPTVTSITPTSGSTAGGDSVVITGTRFTGVTAVTFGGNAALPFSVDSATQITATTPPHAVGPVNVVVTTPGGASATPISYTYVSVPDAPTGVTAVPGNGMATVSFTPPVNDGGSAITGYVATSSPSGIIGICPGNATSINVAPLTNGISYTFTVTATNAIGDSAASSPSSAVTPRPVPTVTGVSPNTGTPAGNDVVTLTGTGFTGATAVTFGGNAAVPITVNSNTSITATTPAHAAGAVSVVVTTPGGTSAPNTLYTYVSPNTAPVVAVDGGSGPDTFSAAGSLATARQYHTASVLANGQVLVTGGYNNNGRLNSAELYDPATNTWTAVGSLATARSDHTASVLANGQVLVTGGYNSGHLSSAELYDPATNTWTAAGSLTTARHSHTASVLANGQVLVTGGYENSGFLSSAELYNPATNTWTAAGSLAMARRDHTASVLANGKVLVTGGYDNSGSLSSAELYDPATNTWTAAGSLATARGSHTASLLANGKVLVTGGYNSGHLSSAELYDPATNTWTAAGSLATARTLHTASVLANGKVLVSAGYNSSGIRSSAELYGPATVTRTATEGSLATQTGTLSDADGNATVTLAASSGTVTQNNAAGTWSWSATGADGPATSTITITATDTASATATASFTFTVTNVAPTFDLGSNVSLPVGPGALSRTVSFTDPGADIWSGTVNYGDGGGSQSLSVNQAAKTFALSHTYTTTGTYTVSVTLNDDDSGTTTDTVVIRALSTDATLSSLVLTTAAFTPAFASGTTSYTSTVPNATASVIATPTVTDANATVQVRVNGGVYSAVASTFPSGSLALNLGPNTIDVLVTAEDGTTTKLYTVAVTRVATTPVSSPAGDVVSGGGAPDASGADSGADFDVLKRGSYLAENGHLVFPGQLLINGTTVTLSPNNFMGLWKESGTGLKLLARSGTAAPEAEGALFDVLPQTPAINDSGEVTFLASLVVGSGSPTVTSVDNDTGIWSELGGSGLGLLIREGDVIPPLAPLQVGGFASGAYATAHTGATTGEAAFAVAMKNGSTDTAILRTSVSGASVAVGVVARENTAMPGVAGQSFGSLTGSYTDSMRMDATGNLAFVALSKPSSKESLWYQPVAGATTKVFIAGDTAPGTTGATFKNIKSPAIGSGGVITFRGLLNADGDNTGGKKGDGIWRGTGSTAAGYTCILRSGDTAVAGLPVGSKVGNLWHSWLTNANHGAWKGWLDVNGNGTSSTADSDVNAIYSDLSGTMNFVLKVGDAAPGIAGATFSGFDLPVVGGVEQMAFIGNVTGGGTTSANNSGVWRSAPNGGALTLVIRTGDTMTTSQGVRTIQKVDFPGSGSTDRRWEQPIMDATGRLIVYVTFTPASGGGTSQILVP